jgi:hypothetical protein
MWLQTPYWFGPLHGRNVQLLSLRVHYKWWIAHVPITEQGYALALAALENKCNLARKFWQILENTLHSVL